MLVWKLLCWWWRTVVLVREKMTFASWKMFREVLWCDIKIRNDTRDRGCYWWRLLEEKLHLYLSHETLSDCHVSQKTAVLMMMNSFVLVREIFIEDYQRPALMCHQDQRRHTWPASPGLLLMMTSRRETLHFEDVSLSRETVSDVRKLSKKRNSVLRPSLS